MRILRRVSNILSLMASLFLICLVSCNERQTSDDGLNGDPEFIRVSEKYPRYFETTGGRPWIPVMINDIFYQTERKWMYSGRQNNILNTFRSMVAIQ